MTPHPTPTVPPLPHPSATPAQDAYAVACALALLPTARPEDAWRRLDAAWQRVAEGR